MFIGHFGIGLAAKKAAPAISLGTLFLSCQLLDLLWPSFLLLGWEHVAIEPGNTKMTPLHFTHYPVSHSLLMACVWGIMTGLIYYLFKRHKRGAVVLGLCVVSHWALDLLVHAPDLPLFPWDSPKVGMGLWNHIVIELILEGLIFISGVLLYLKTTRVKNNIGRYSFWSLIVFLVLIQIINMMSPPPPNVTAIAWAGQLQWLIVIWGYWADRNRAVVN